jgi:beta-N-acetylhexosaminidase
LSSSPIQGAVRRPNAVIFGCAGPELTAAEAAFFTAADPFGFILFQRNCIEPDQIRRLVAALRATVGRADAPVLIDQEGGRVQRLKPPHWRAAPPASVFAELWRRDRTAGLRAAWINARLIAADLHALGITVDCAPVLDLPAPGADNVIGDRAHGNTPDGIAALGRAVADGLLAGGVLPVAKHVPGHGRATVDSHFACPVVDASGAELSTSDFVPFRALNDLPYAMTAHVVLTAIDPTEAATLSRRVIETVIRGEIGFDGVLLSDDLSMRALSGTVGERARDALTAGCDILLHCNGEAAEMRAIADVCRPIDDKAARRIARASSRRLAPESMDRSALLEELDTLLRVPAGGALA